MTPQRYRVTRDGGIKIKVANDLVRILSTVSAELLAHPPKTNYWVHDGGVLIQVWLDERRDLQTRYYCNWGHQNPDLEAEVKRILITYMPIGKEGM